MTGVYKDMIRDRIPFMSTPIISMPHTQWVKCEHVHDFCNETHVQLQIANKTRKQMNKVTWNNDATT